MVRSEFLQALGQWDPSALTCEVVEARGVVRQKHVAEVKPGERVRVHPGAMIPVDGFVCSGESFVHEASMSGEAFAASRRAGDHVLAGTHVVDSTLVIEAEAAEPRAASIAFRAVLQEAVLQPGESQLVANRIMQWFVPFVVATALLTFGVA